MSYEIFFVGIFFIRIANFARILPPMNLFATIPLAMITIGIVGISCCHLLYIINSDIGVTCSLPKEKGLLHQTLACSTKFASQSNLSKYLIDAYEGMSSGPPIRDSRCSDLLDHFLSVSYRVN